MAIRKMMYHLLLFIQSVPPFLVGQISRLIPHNRRLLKALLFSNIRSIRWYINQM